METKNCWYCGEETDDSIYGRRAYTEDHQTPLCQGGSSRSANKVVACRSCNLSKARKTVDEYRHSLAMAEPLYVVRHQIKTALSISLLSPQDSSALKTCLDSMSSPVKIVFAGERVEYKISQEVAA